LRSNRDPVGAMDGIEKVAYALLGFVSLQDAAEMLAYGTAVKLDNSQP
jgi:hypothetical protein